MIMSTKEQLRKKTMLIISLLALALSALYPYTMSGYLQTTIEESAKAAKKPIEYVKTERELQKFSKISTFDLLSAYSKIRPTEEAQVDITQVKIHNPNFYHIEGRADSLDKLHSYVHLLQSQFPDLEVHLDKYYREEHREFIISVGEINEKD